MFNVEELREPDPILSGPDLSQLPHYLSPLTPASLASLLFLEHGKLIPASGPLHLLFLLWGSFS